MLTASRWAVEQNTSAWHHAELEELLRMLDWILDQLLELPLDIGQASDIVPGHCGHLHHCLSDRRGGGLAHRIPEALTNISKEVFLKCIDQMRVFYEEH